MTANFQFIDSKGTQSWSQRSHSLSLAILLRSLDSFLLAKRFVSSSCLLRDQARSMMKGKEKKENRKHSAFRSARRVKSLFLFLTPFSSLIPILLTQTGSATPLLSPSYPLSFTQRILLICLSIKCDYTKISVHPFLLNSRVTIFVLTIPLTIPALIRC